MSTVFNFGGKTIIEPGAYAQIKSGIPQPPFTGSFGSVVIIDSGIGTKDYASGTPAYFGGGSGINGTLQNGKNAIYSFTDPNVFRNFIRGGLLWDAASYLFSPDNQGSPGIDKLYYISAKTSAPAAFTYTIAGTGDLVNSGTITGTTSTATIAGVNTKFLTEVAVGDTLKNLAGTTIGTVLSIQSNTALTLSGNSSVATTAVGYKVNHTASGGTIVLQTNWEGLVANGLEGAVGLLTRGFATKLIAGIADPTKFIVQFYAGTFKGLDKDGNPYDGVAEINTSPQLLTQSVELRTIPDFLAWAVTDSNFTTYFKVQSSTTTGFGNISAADLTTYAGNGLFAGATQTYGSSDFDTVLANITDLDNTFFLADRWGYHVSPAPNFSTATDSDNFKILAHILNDAKYNKFLIIGGGLDATQFTGVAGSIGFAQAYNSSKVVIVHSGSVIPSQIGFGTRNVESIYTAAKVLGRMAGQEPQVPVTYKNIGILQPLHDLSKTQRETALQAGVLHLKNVSGLGWVVNEDVNTNQLNTSLINPDGSSYVIQVERIKAQLNKELVINGELKFVGQNRFTASAADIKAFTEGYLISKTAKTGQDNLIISFQNVTVKLVNGNAWYISYGFVPNSEIKALFFTGYILDANLSA